MGDWNTLHIFNDRHFFGHLVPDFRDKGTIFKSYIDSPVGKHFLWDYGNVEARTWAMVNLCRQLGPDFKKHEEYYEIQRREKKPGEEYKDFLFKRNLDEDRFRQVSAEAIEDLNNLLTLIIFTECAAFNPHLILGRRVFTGNVTAKPGSLADCIIAQIYENELGSPYYHRMSNCSGLINWVTAEELQLLWLDRENLQVAPDGSSAYLQEFLAFAEVALQQECGFISVTNVNEGLLCKIENPRLTINIDPKERGWESVIIYPGRQG